MPPARREAEGDGDFDCDGLLVVPLGVAGETERFPGDRALTVGGCFAVAPRGEAAFGTRVIVGL